MGITRYTTIRCLRCFYISNASHQNNSCWRKLSHTCTLLSLFTLGDSMSDRRRARQNQSRKYWMTWKTGTIFMTGPLLKCWIIDYIKPTSCESWDLQKLFDSSGKVKTNFKTEIKGARNERMWSQAWNPGFTSHKNSTTGQPANYHCDSPKLNLFTWATIEMQVRWYEQGLFVKIITTCHSCNPRT